MGSAGHVALSAGLAGPLWCWSVRERVPADCGQLPSHEGAAGSPSWIVILQERRLRVNPPGSAPWVNVQPLGVVVDDPSTLIPSLTRKLRLKAGRFSGRVPRLGGQVCRLVVVV